MPVKPDPLQQLQEIRTPDVSGESVVADLALSAALGIGLAVLAALVLRAATRRIPDPRRTAARKLAALGTLPAEERPTELARVLSALAEALDGAPASLSLTADRQRLDHLLGARYFTEGPGAALAAGLYRPEATDLAEAARGDLIRLLERGAH